MNHHQRVEYFVPTQREPRKIHIFTLYSLRKLEFVPQPVKIKSKREKQETVIYKLATTYYR